MSGSPFRSPDSHAQWPSFRASGQDEARGHAFCYTFRLNLSDRAFTQLSKDISDNAEEAVWESKRRQTAATSDALPPAKKFAEMTVFERNAVRRKIAERDLPAIFQAMLDAGRIEHDPLKQMGLQITLAEAFREKNPSPQFLSQLKAFLTDSSNVDFERHLLIGALEHAATKETLELLVQVASSSSEQRIPDAAGSLAGVGASGRGGPELSPILEHTWRESNNPDQLLSAATSMARIGAPSSIELLLAAALDANGTDLVRTAAARRALEADVIRPEAVPALASRLDNQPAASATAELVAPILVRIGDAHASQAIVRWLQGRSENAGALIDDLIRQRTITESMLSAWGTAVDSTVPFRNEQNREAIRAGLAAYRAGHTRQP